MKQKYTKGLYQMSLDNSEPILSDNPIILKDIEDEITVLQDRKDISKTYPVELLLLMDDDMFVKMLNEDCSFIGTSKQYKEARKRWKEINLKS